MRMVHSTTKTGERLIRVRHVIVITIKPIIKPCNSFLFLSYALNFLSWHVFSGGPYCYPSITLLFGSHLNSYTQLIRNNQNPLCWTSFLKEFSNPFHYFNRRISCWSHVSIQLAQQVFPVCKHSLLTADSLAFLDLCFFVHFRNANYKVIQSLSDSIIWPLLDLEKICH